MKNALLVTFVSLALAVPCQPRRYSQLTPDEREGGYILQYLFVIPQLDEKGDTEPEIYRVAEGPTPPAEIRPSLSHVEFVDMGESYSFRYKTDQLDECVGWCPVLVISFSDNCPETRFRIYCELLPELKDELSSKCMMAYYIRVFFNPDKCIPSCEADITERDLEALHEEMKWGMGRRLSRL